MEYKFEDYICIYILVVMHTYFKRDVRLGYHIYICILVAIHTFWNRCAFGESHLYLHFCCNVHLFWKRYILKYNCIHIFTEKMTLIKYYCNLYHISSMIEENKINFVSWMHEPHSNPLTHVTFQMRCSQPNITIITLHFIWNTIN